ncbi:dipeptide ABC transporter ATP-binding protein [Caenispirillum salinarum]|uniref:dipeptide ABC transporter ATP-binding protein n=1 Tax=Caenispirillum salinarum TaxID=859058 RepID=UPI00384AF47E
MPLLDIQNMTVEFGEESSPFRAVDGLSLTVNEGEVVGIVGESGSGKSVSSLATMGLVAYPGRVTADRMHFAGQDLQAMSARKRRKLTGSEIAMIFQEPMTSLNPCFTVGWQIMEALKIHEGGSRKERRERAEDLLRLVGIPDPGRRLSAFPHQMSGGMSQRVMIAMALACNPRLLIADEPTTALDVTIQAQIMDLLLDLQQQRGMGMVLITHDLAVVAEAAHRVVVMYAGQVVETGTVPEVFEHPRHPYTQALLASLPENSVGRDRLQTLPGVVPGAYDRPHGCLLHPRCPYSQRHCREEQPKLFGEGPFRHRCFYPLDDEGNPTYD